MRRGYEEIKKSGDALVCRKAMKARRSSSVHVSPARERQWHV